MAAFFQPFLFPPRAHSGAFCAVFGSLDARTPAPTDDFDEQNRYDSIAF
jgi:hypothetical protein